MIFKYCSATWQSWTRHSVVMAVVVTYRYLIYMKQVMNECIHFFKCLLLDSCELLLSWMYTLLYHWISNGCICENCLNDFCCLRDSVCLKNLRLGGGTTENLCCLKWENTKVERQANMVTSPHTSRMLCSPTHCTGWSPRHSTGHHWRRNLHSSGTQCCWSLIPLGWDRTGTEPGLLSLSLAMSMWLRYLQQKASLSSVVVEFLLGSHLCERGGRMGLNTNWVCWNIILT